ncbi:unnamed protein product [Colias eurytheme]|nr:unnamed protein product [Colias eurytheme]
MRWFVYLLLLPACFAHLNVYLSSEEVWRLLAYFLDILRYEHKAVLIRASGVGSAADSVSEPHSLWRSTIAHLNSLRLAKCRVTSSR